MCAPRESSPSTSTKATISTPCASRKAKTRSSSERTMEWPFVFTRTASGRWAAAPPAEGEEPEAVAVESELDEGEEIVASDERGQVLTITEKGFGKRTPVSAYRLQSRGGIGVTNIKTTDKNGKVAGISYVFEDDQVLLITEQGMIIRTNVADIRSIGRNTQGVRVINIDENDLVVAAVKLVDK